MALDLNLRHLRAFVEVAERQTISAAAHHVYLSQPAITQALAKLEARLEVRLFERRSTGMFLTEPGSLFYKRVVRALKLIAEGAEQATKLGVKGGARGFSRFDQLMTVSQLRSLLAVADAGNFSLAARAIHVSQPTLHRTARDLERLSGMALFDKISQGISLTAAARALAKFGRLALSELNQGFEELETWRGLDTGRIVVGTLPLARSNILPHAINQLVDQRPDVDISVIDGPYDDLLNGLRHGEIDLMTGALRDPLPIEDVRQEPLYSDLLAIVGRAGHPLSKQQELSAQDIAEYPWVVPRAGTPTRTIFENLFDRATIPVPAHVIESSSLVLIRGLLLGSDRLTIVSANQVHLEVSNGLLQQLPIDMSHTARPIGLTTRADWLPTATQSQFVELLRQAGRQFQMDYSIIE